MSGVIRAVLLLGGFLALTVPLMPVQWLLVRWGRHEQRYLPHWYHRHLCRLLGIDIHTNGQIRNDQAVLVISNHVSWLDILVLSALAPVSFVAKKEVSRWPLIGSLARLQRTVFVDRGTRISVGRTSNEMIARLQAGDHVVLFAEGTSSDGNQVLPFKTSLFAAVKPSRRVHGVLNPDRSGMARPGGANSNGTWAGDRQVLTVEPNTAWPGTVPGTVYVQTVAIAYLARHGLPLGRQGRAQVAWYGDLEMPSHAWALLKGGPLDVHVTIGEPVPLQDFADRKALARYTEQKIRTDVIRLLRGRKDEDGVTATSLPKTRRHVPLPASNKGKNTTWV